MAYIPLLSQTGEANPPPPAAHTHSSKHRHCEKGTRLYHKDTLLNDTCIHIKTFQA